MAKTSTLPLRIEKIRAIKIRMTHPPPKKNQSYTTRAFSMFAKLPIEASLRHLRVDLLRVTQYKKHCGVRRWPSG